MASASCESSSEAGTGYIYCMSNESMPGLLKIGMTMESPDERAKELSSSTGVPTPFRVEISKCVMEPYEKEQLIHKLLGELGFRVNERREFFNCSLKSVEYLFALIDGTNVVIGNTETSAIVRKLTVNVIKLDS